MSSFRRASWTYRPASLPTIWRARHLVRFVVAVEMLNTFPTIRFSLLVGVRGVPSSGIDVSLSDVVVSRPDQHIRWRRAIRLEKNNRHGSIFSA
ncbi:hypothetical protein BDV11DRAFT_139984 [Aspergillus similis]